MPYKIYIVRQRTICSDFPRSLHRPAFKLQPLDPISASIRLPRVVPAHMRETSRFPLSTAPRKQLTDPQSQLVRISSQPHWKSAPIPQLNPHPRQILHPARRHQDIVLDANPAQRRQLIHQSPIDELPTRTAALRLQQHRNEIQPRLDGEHLAHGGGTGGSQ